MSLEERVLPFLFSNNSICFPVWKYFLTERCKSLSELYEIIHKLFDKNFLKSQEEAAMASYKSSLAARVEWIDYFDPRYPKLLKEIHHPPLTIFYKGNAEIFSKELIAIVGTRNPSPISITACNLLPDFVARIQNSGIVSGLAIGIDRAAMFSCMEKSIPVLGVMGTGFDQLYPNPNRDLYKRMESNGNTLIISEVKYGEQIGKWSFPKRNRIITGLCKATIIMEAPLESGAMSSAGHALNQNREIMVFDHPESLRNEGGKKLLSDGASLLSWSDLSGQKNKFIHISELFPKDYNNVSEYLSFVSGLEMKGLIKDRGAGYFELNN